MPFVNAGIGAARSILAIPGKSGATSFQLPKDADVSIEFGDYEIPKGARLKVRGSNPRRVPLSDLGAPTARGSVSFPAAPDDRVSAFLSKLYIATVASLLSPETALSSVMDRHRENAWTADPAKHLPLMQQGVPGGKGLEPTWAVILAPDGLVLELWAAYRLAIRLDGADPISGGESGAVLHLPEGPQCVVGGPKELLAQRRRGKELSPR